MTSPVPDPGGARAFLDESGHVGPPGLYVVAAVGVSLHEHDRVRLALRAALRHRRTRFHWRDEEHADQEVMARCVGELELVAVVAVATPVQPRRRERARRKCLTQLLWELQQRNVNDVLFESRRDHLDRSDQHHIGNEIRAGVLDRDLRYGFALPSEEPLLWLPDLVAGAVNRAMTEQRSCCLDLLGPHLTVLAPVSGV